ncbi:MAG: DUF4153 domain-containing protein, partial [Verrucomicrobiales bacterium]
MSTESESGQNTEPNQSDEAAKAPAVWIWNVLITGAALTGAANYLLYSRGPGAGWALFFLLLAVGIFLNRRSSGSPTKVAFGLGLLLSVSAVQMLVRPSLSNAIVLFTLTLIASTHFLQDAAPETPTARKLVEALRNLLLSPMRWLQASHLIAQGGIAHSHEIGKRIPSPKNLSRAIQIVVPAAALVLLFAILLGKGNSILGQFISNLLTDFLDGLTRVSPPSPGRIFFIAVIATSLLGILWRSRPSKALDRALARLGRSIPAPSDQFVARWRTILILVGVNVLFFISNSIELTYIGSSLELPRHLTYSEFVHQGTNSLIASAIIAAIVLGLLFQQDDSVTSSRAIRGLAGLWIAQNLLLIANVARRVGIYISDYHLSVLRLHLVLFLGLVCIGFGLLAVRILQRRSFGWLVRANLAAVFILFATIQFWDTRRVVAEFNLARALEDEGKTLDTYYLSRLGPSAWPTLREATTANLS